MKHKCKNCGITDPFEFYIGSYSACKKCTIVRSNKGRKKLTEDVERIQGVGWTIESLLYSDDVGIND